MTVLKKFGYSVLVSIIVLCGLEVGEQLSIPGIHSFISTAEAVVGRPLTPASVAGVARRSVRRCAVGVTVC
jgi:hypothetical protein